MTDRPAAEPREPPPRWLMRVVNPVVSAVMRSPVGARLRRRIVLLGFTGWRTGRRYTLPVGRHDLDGSDFVVVTDERWRLNMRGGAPVTVNAGDGERSGTGTLVEDPDEVARVYRRLLDRYGNRQGTTRLGLRITADRPLTEEELRAAIAGRSLIRVVLD